MSDFSSDDEDVCQRPQRPKTQSNHIGGYDFFDIAGKDVKTIMESMDQLPDFDQSIEIAPQMHDSDKGSYTLDNSDNEASPESRSERRTSSRSTNRKSKISRNSDNEVEVVAEQKLKKVRETTPPLEISALKDAISIKSTPNKPSSSRLRLDDVAVVSSSQVQLVIKVEPFGGKSFKLRIFEDVPLKDVFHQSALVICV
jgi:hypothetical protein